MEVIRGYLLTRTRRERYYKILAKSGIEPKLTDHETIVRPLHYLALETLSLKHEIRIKRLELLRI